MRGAGKADPFESLDDEFKDAIAASSPEEINKRIAQVVQNEQELQRARTVDQHLAECKAEVKRLSAPYDAKTKEHNLLMNAISRVLQDKAIVTATGDDLKRRLSEAAKAEEENQVAKASDQKLEQAKTDASDADAGYKDGTKMNRLRVLYCMRCLSDKGAA